jgi:lysyl-tRNA synthetase class 2
MSPARNPRIYILKDRAAMLEKARAFFKERAILEVDCPIVSSAASVDAHIDLVPVLDINNQRKYMHSSPEYGMKRLLAEGIGDIYQLSHVFRLGELGVKHNPEFMMAEWYRIGFTFSQLIEETLAFVRLFLGNLPSRILSYREVFKQFAGIDYLISEDLMAEMHQLGITPYPNSMQEGRDALLNQILGLHIEPQLGKNELFVLSHYPASQAALAQVVDREGELVAERFEIYYQGIELANGYYELTNPQEQKRRFIEANQMRESLGKEPLPIDENFLQALEKGLPDCCGVAVGFDRLMMLRNNVNSISEAIPFDWSSA